MTIPVPGYHLKLGAVIVLAAALVAGCAAPRRAPVVERTPQAKPAAPEKAAPIAKPAVSPDARPPFHTVKKGETLYSIALEYGLDYKELAAWNNIDPTKVQAGQQLRLTPPDATVSAAPLKSAPSGIEARPLGTPPAGAPGVAQAGTAPKPEAELAAKPEPRAAPKPEPAQEAGGLSWTWPATGKVVGGFNGSTAKGITIAGKLGQPVLASAGGKVIHSGAGIRGLGKFIVIKHNDAYLSVYAHNSQLLVKEGDSVTRGQKIAEMGNSDADQVKLHFEIRHFGKPVDPVKVLPDRPA
jgi:lipoprotein NlpD